MFAKLVQRGLWEPNVTSNVLCQCTERIAKINVTVVQKSVIMSTAVNNLQVVLFSF